MAVALEPHVTPKCCTQTPRDGQVLHAAPRERASRRCRVGCGGARRADVRVRLVAREADAAASAQRSTAAGHLRGRLRGHRRLLGPPGLAGRGGACARDEPIRRHAAVGRDHAAGAGAMGSGHLHVKHRPARADPSRAAVRYAQVGGHLPREMLHAITHRRAESKPDGVAPVGPG
eukprot:1634823-Prymnesium_polylepis.1